MANLPKLKRHEFNLESNGIIEKAITGFPTKLEKFSISTNLRAFYNELHDTLVHNLYGRFTDMLGDPEGQKVGDFFDGQAKLGEHVDNGLPSEGGFLNRTGDMFETHFMWAKKMNSIEMEVKWKAKMDTPYSAYGWVEFELDLVNRFLTDKEVLVGNEKKVLQSGSWEFRNKIKYKNKVLKKLKKVPFIKDYPSIQGLYIDYVYYEKILKDIEFCETKIKPLIYKVIYKYFR